ncbi:HEAT repeat domain-containing protein [Williamsia deligens]|uniref:HEAT repeat domain-containing protein n=1 Tax=Williamsia deligens TaxID=321325 RepID=A0ABW3GB37_9NOCA|nr:HEAT repeat domain-containing protein [Williamsia deligens]MCP2192360.1 HEAT repeat-containing protein [Williamsia deligens]
MTPTTRSAVVAALDRPDPSARLRAAVYAGTHPDPEFVEALVRRCGIDPDFFVRDMLTWALTRHAASLVLPRVVAELDSDEPQARSQALHTLTKLPGVGAMSADLWPRVLSLVDDPVDEVATTAWRAAVAVVPTGQESALVDTLLAQLGVGGEERQRRLTRSLVALDRVADGPVREAMSSTDERVARHAARTARLLDDPDSGDDDALHEARRVAVMGSDADR